MNVEVCKTIWRGNHLFVRASFTGDSVLFGISDKDYYSSSLWEHRVRGYVQPMVVRRWWRRERQMSVREAMEEVVAELHRREFKISEAESQVEATHTIRQVLAELEAEFAA